MRKQEPRQVRQKRGKFYKFFVFIIILVIVVLLGGFIAFNWYNDAIYKGLEGTDEVEVQVGQGESLVNLADELEQKGLIKSKDALRVYLRLNNLSPNIKVGTYLLQKNLNIPQLIEVLEDGVFKPAIWTTIQEGLRNEDIAEILNSQLSDAGDKKKFDLDEFLEIINDPDSQVFSDEVKEFLEEAKPQGKPLTGYLFPDTYRFNSDATSQEIVEAMILNLKQRLSDNEIDPKNVMIDSGRTTDFYNALVLASILEKEAGRDDDINLVSGLFYNRINQNYPLQSDATVNFATGKNERGASFEDLKIDSPYNTYKYAGLPPTPINNPGIRSLKAAINPTETNYFFFWHSSQNKIYFAVTYEEHQRNIQRYP